MMRTSKIEGLHKWTLLFYLFITARGTARKYHGHEFVT